MDAAEVVDSSDNEEEEIRAQQERTLQTLMGGMKEIAGKMQGTGACYTPINLNDIW